MAMHRPVVGGPPLLFCRGLVLLSTLAIVASRAYPAGNDALYVDIGEPVVKSIPYRVESRLLKDEQFESNEVWDRERAARQLNKDDDAHRERLRFDDKVVVGTKLLSTIAINPPKSEPVDDKVIAEPGRIPTDVVDIFDVTKITDDEPELLESEVENKKSTPDVEPLKTIKEINSSDPKLEVSDSEKRNSDLKVDVSDPKLGTSDEVFSESKLVTSESRKEEAASNLDVFDSEFDASNSKYEKSPSTLDVLDSKLNAAGAENEKVSKLDGADSKLEPADSTKKDSTSILEAPKEAESNAKLETHDKKNESIPQLDVLDSKIQTLDSKKGSPASDIDVFNSKVEKTDSKKVRPASEIDVFAPKLEATTSGIDSTSKLEAKQEKKESTSNLNVSDSKLETSSSKPEDASLVSNVSKLEESKSDLDLGKPSKFDEKVNEEDIKNSEESKLEIEVPKETAAEGELAEAIKADEFEKESNVSLVKPDSPSKDPEFESRVSYSGSQVWKVVMSSESVRKAVKQLSEMKAISAWGGNTTAIDFLVRADSTDIAKTLLDGANARYEVIIDDLQRAIDTENPEIDFDEELANRRGHRMTWQSYHRLSDIHGYLDFLATAYPNLCSVRTIGTSHQGRALKLLRISNGNASNKAVWVDGGIHAREWISPATVTYIIDQIVEGYDTESETIKNIDWYILPVANPDGYEYSHTTDRLWRKNRRGSGQCSGTDLNRNFGYRWGGKGTSHNPCQEIYCGISAFSEPETAAIKNFFDSTGADFKAYLSFHSYGQYILYPWGYDNVVPPDYQDLQTVAQKAAQDELETTKNKLKSPLTASPKTELALQLELDNALENLKDFKEHNTALQLQLDTLNSSHQTLKLCNEELANTNKTLERKVAESELIISRLKTELKSIQNKYNALLEQETVLKKSVEVERLQNKSLKLQNEKDAKCIQDLTRQVREMERIIARKHPDSVSALIVTANANMDQNARKILEDRIKQLESEARSRETHSSKLFTDVQEKFNTMKLKYESHIEDLEHHVADLKLQLSNKVSPELIENWTQTFFDENRNVHSNDIGVQTISQPTKVSKPIQTKRPEKNLKEDAHLLATIRGLNLEIANKEKVMFKLQREMDELRKTNKKLQKEREGALKSNLIERMREVKCYNPDEYKLQYDKEADLDNMNQQVSAIREERDKLKIQLCRLEDDYEALKLKRLQDLNTLQEAHEQELTNYMAKMSPLREQLEVQQVTINKLQSQLASAREQITVLIVERDHLESRLSALRQLERENTGGESDKSEYAILRKKISQLERRYEDRELRLRAIVHGLAQKQAFSNRDCQQCLLRQQQLCGYKAELDQVLLTLRNHTKL